MSKDIDGAILRAIAREGSVSDVENQGFTSAQIVLAMKAMLADGRLVRNGSKFQIGPNAEIVSSQHKHWKPLEILSEYAVEKITETDQYEIGHQTFTQIKLRVRP